MRSSPFRRPMLRTEREAARLIARRARRTAARRRPVWRGLAPPLKTNNLAGDRMVGATAAVTAAVEAGAAFRRGGGRWVCGTAGLDGLGGQELFAGGGVGVGEPADVGVSWLASAAVPPPPPALFPPIHPLLLLRRGLRPCCRWASPADAVGGRVTRDPPLILLLLFCRSAPVVRGPTAMSGGGGRG